MGFLAPWFLAGVAAVGLPIWIHLLKRHKTDPRLFPSLMLFEKREVSSVKHRRLEYLLLFALRVAMLILLALLFANPFIRRSVASSETNKLTVVAVDHSFSMRAGDRLAQAKSEALSVLSNVKPGAQAQVIALGGQVQSLTQPTTDMAELRAAVASIEPGDTRASFGELARYARTLSESVKLPIDLHLASDLQKSAMPPGFADMRLNPGTTLVLHQIGQPAPNWAVENVIAPRRVYDPKKVRVQATIANFGGQTEQAPHAALWQMPDVVYAADQSHAAGAISKRVVSLLLNGKVLQTKTVDVPENGRAQVEFLGLEAPYGFSRGEVRIDSADVLPADDRFPFSVERIDPRKVLFLDDGRGGNALLYFRAALDAAPDAAFQLEALRAEQAANLPLTNYAFIVLSNLGSLPPGFEDSLKRYVSAGGSVLVVLGSASAAMQHVPVLEDPIQTSTYAGREAGRFLTVADIDTGHPALRSVERFTGVKFYQAIRVTPGKSHVLAKLNDDTPLVLEQQLGEGKALVFASTFDNNANDLPLHASWVPFVQQTAAYLAGGAGTEQPTNLTVDSYVDLRTADSKGAAEVLGPDGNRLLSLEEAATAKNFAAHSEGFYELKAANGRHSLLAVHADRRESDLALMPKEIQDLWKATGQSDQTSQGASTLGDQDDKRPWGLWPILLLLLLGVAVAESVVADRYLRPPSEDQRKEAA